MDSQANKIELNLNADVDVSVKGHIAPIEYTQYNFHVDWDELANFQVAEAEKQYPASVFQTFLPSTPVSVGECWRVGEESALTLLQQLHPHTKLTLDNDDGDYQGIWACLRAYNEKHAEIVFRVHAEFIFKNGKFTPSQFAGYMIIDRIQGNLLSFKMSVPPTTLNFDAGWKQKDGNYFAEIGYCPQLELSAGTFLADIDYTQFISREEAESILILHYYRFHRVNWKTLEEAVELAPILRKPIHVVSLDGPLFDESC